MLFYKEDAKGKQLFEEARMAKAFERFLRAFCLSLLCAFA